MTPEGSHILPTRKARTYTTFPFAAHLVSKTFTPMKKLFVTLSLFMAFSVESQTQQHKLGIAVGGGSQKYAGDLGNGFTFRNRVWRGGVGLDASYYISPSFDAGITGYIGDLGYCQPHDMANKEIAPEHRCPGCLFRVGLGNLSSRMYTTGFSVRYKFANGYLLREDFPLQPSMHFGLTVNKLADRMKMNCVGAGNYLALNAGFGVRYYVTERLHAGYSVNVGYFLSDGVDFIASGGNDLYLQNNIVLGVDLF